MKVPANIGKTTIIVNQGKSFVVKTRYTYFDFDPKTRTREKKKLLVFFFSRVRVLSVKIKNDGFKWNFLERINNLDPCYELSRAINKPGHSKNRLGKRIHTFYNLHSLLFLEQKQFV